MVILLSSPIRFGDVEDYMDMVSDITYFIYVYLHETVIIKE